ncbi:MAG: DUF1858 domain-containing protein [Methermicoccaceae archaeon]
MITKDMGIIEVVESYPETLETFMQYGMGCIGCALASFETVEEGALVHGLDVDKLVADLNAVAGKKEDTEEVQK